MGDPGHLLPLIGLTFLLGLRHGMDPDHLAVVDNITRFNAASDSLAARWCGLFFSLGHGAVVTLVAALLAVAAGARLIPSWVEHLGQGISIVFLLAMGLLNLQTLRRASDGAAAFPHGLKAGVVMRFCRVSHPLAISAIGAAFAISMDTLSQAAVFSLAASGRHAWGVALLLGCVFTLGMLVVDTANGWWVHRMIRSLEQRDRAWTRGLTLAIAILSLGLAAAGLLRLRDAGIADLYAANTLALGGGSVVLLTALFLAAFLTRRPAD